MKKLIPIGVCLVLLAMPILGMAERDDSGKSANWAAIVHEENSLAASILYLPYMALQFSSRIIDGIFNPKPASRATMPPAAHRDDQ